MIDAGYIDTELPLTRPEDFYFLRAEGVKLIEKLSGKVWTDYNTHDPGITLLEAFCYALTDLGYRTAFDIKDLLALRDGEQDISRGNCFYPPEKILPAAPLTLLDYRKLIIDTPGVRNAWIEQADDYEIFIYASITQTKDNNTFQLSYNSSKASEAIHLRGLYQVLVEFDYDINDADERKEVLAVVTERLHAHRNLCEDFLIVSSVEFTSFSLDAEIQVSEGFDLEKINAQIFNAIQNLFSAPVRFHTLEQMRQKGYSTEQIFEGPLLHHGFIDARELNESDQDHNIHLSDVINVIQDIEGVVAVKRCDIPKESQTPYSTFNEWTEENRAHNRKLRLDIDNSKILFHRSGDRHRSDRDTAPDLERVKGICSFLRSGQKTTKLVDPVVSISPPAGTFMDVARYYPLQNNLPEIYTQARNVGDAKTVARNIMQVKQLRSYLMVFEQILADYLGKLSSIRDVYSLKNGVHASIASQPVQGIPELESLFLDYKQFSKMLSTLTESSEKYWEKRNALLDHLLAQVAESMKDFSRYMTNSQAAEVESIANAKSAFLGDYIQVSKYRGCGYNYTDRSRIWTSANVPGIKKRIARLLGIRNYENQFTTADWIRVEKDASERFSPVIYDPQKGTRILLTANNYQSESEARDLLDHILQKGYDKRNYRLSDNKYKLQRLNKEMILTPAAETSTITDEKDDESFDTLISVLHQYAQRENFHVIEHILLRPKIDPQVRPQGPKVITQVCRCTAFSWSQSSCVLL
ncbi:MAG: hypothetical protein EOO88_34880, partial [Pedobacter sp.]